MSSVKAGGRYIYDSTVQVLLQAEIWRIDGTVVFFYVLILIILNYRLLLIILVHYYLMVAVFFFDKNELSRG